MRKIVNRYTVRKGYYPGRPLIDGSHVWVYNLFIYDRVLNSYVGEGGEKYKFIEGKKPRVQYLDSNMPTLEMESELYRKVGRLNQEHSSYEREINSFIDGETNVLNRC